MEQDLSQQRLAVEGGTLSKCPMSWHNVSFLCLSSPSPVGRVSLNLAMVGSTGVHGSPCQGL